MLLKVVYLDDEPFLCENFVDCFSSPEIEITTYTDPELAVQLIQANPPDVLFLDYRLPGTNGDEIAQKLDPSIPKFLVTGDIMVKTEYKFVKVFSKPYDSEDVMAELRKFISELRT